MATIAMFHSALGVRPGFLQVAVMLRKHGHYVHVIDQYDGQVFDDYESAAAYVSQVGFPALMQRAMEATGDLPGGFVTMGFSNGAGMAEYVAGSRPGVAGVLMLSGALDPAVVGINWPAGVNGQVHSTVNDPRREQEAIDAVRVAAESAGAHVEVYDYPGSGHLFADASKADEYQPADAELMWTRVLEFLRGVDQS